MLGNPLERFFFRTVQYCSIISLERSCQSRQYHEPICHDGLPDLIPQIHKDKTNCQFINAPYLA